MKQNYESFCTEGEIKLSHGGAQFQHDSFYNVASPYPGFSTVCTESLKFTVHK